MGELGRSLEEGEGGPGFLLTAEGGMHYRVLRAGQQVSPAAQPHTIEAAAIIESLDVEPATLEALTESDRDGLLYLEQCVEEAIQ